RTASLGPRSRAAPQRQQERLGRLLLQESLKPEHMADRRSLKHPFAERRKVRPLLETNHLLGPAGDHKQVWIGQREVLAHQERPCAEATVDPVELLCEVRLHELLEFVGRLAVEQKSEALVQLGGDE